MTDCDIQSSGHLLNSLVRSDVLWKGESERQERVFFLCACVLTCYQVTRSFSVHSAVPLFTAWFALNIRIRPHRFTSSHLIIRSLGSPCFGHLRPPMAPPRWTLAKLFLLKPAWHTHTHTDTGLKDMHTPPTWRWCIHVQMHICTTEECLCLTHVAHPRVWQSVRHLSASVIKWCMVLQVSQLD